MESEIIICSGERTIEGFTEFISGSRSEVF